MSTVAESVIPESPIDEVSAASGGVEAIIAAWKESGLTAQYIIDTLGFDKALVEKVFNADDYEIVNLEAPQQMPSGGDAVVDHPTDSPLLLTAPPIGDSALKPIKSDQLDEDVEQQLRVALSSLQAQAPSGQSPDKSEHTSGSITPFIPLALSRKTSGEIVELDDGTDKVKDQNKKVVASSDIDTDAENVSISGSNPNVIATLPVAQSGSKSSWRIWPFS